MSESDSPTPPAIRADAYDRLVVVDAAGDDVENDEA